MLRMGIRNAGIIAVKKALALLGLEIRRARTPLLGCREVPVRTVLDIGANIGQFATFIGEQFPTARVYSFEPLPDVFESLVKTTDRLGERFMALNYGLGEHRQQLVMHRHLEHSPSSSLLSTTPLAREQFTHTVATQPVQVQIISLDELVASRTIVLEAEVFIKVDVQGFEDRVLRGGQQTVKGAAACLLEVSLVPLYEGQPTFSTLLDLMEEFGFMYAGNMEQGQNVNARVLQVDALFLRKDLAERI
jgi:FkbM family methyltransferase